MPDEHKRFQDMLRICKWHLKRKYYDFLELKKYYGLPKKPKCKLLLNKVVLYLLVLLLL